MSQNEHVDNQVNYRIGKLQVEDNVVKPVEAKIKPLWL
jgi:hypothetical protein